MEIFVKDRAFYRKLATLALPIAGQSLISVGVNMMDNNLSLRVDQFIKAIWRLFRLKSGKWIKKIQGAASPQR